jgi:hypothetical protein
MDTGEITADSSATAEILVALPRAQVWERLRDLGIAHYYVPGLTDTRFTTAQREGVGTSRKVYQKGMAPMDETVVEWREGYGFVLRLHNGDKAPLIFKQAYFSYAIEDAGPQQTRFRPALIYTLRWGACGRLLDRLFINRSSGAMLRKLARSFKQFYETGKPSNPAFRAEAG